MEDEYAVGDLVSLAYDQKPIDFQRAFDGIVRDRLADAIAAEKAEVAKSMFSGPDEPLDDDDDSAEVEDEFDFDDEELDQEEEQDGETA